MMASDTGTVVIVEAHLRPTTTSIHYGAIDVAYPKPDFTSHDDFSAAGTCACARRDVHNSKYMESECRLQPIITKLCSLQAE